eukprot:1138894-Pelagomonas_calceolata.AAC.6
MHVRLAASPQGYEQDKLAEAVRGCDLVIVPAGVPRKPGMTRDDLFKVKPAPIHYACAQLSSETEPCVNAGIVKGLVEAVGKHAPGRALNLAKCQAGGLVHPVSLICCALAWLDMQTGQVLATICHQHLAKGEGFMKGGPQQTVMFEAGAWKAGSLCTHWVTLQLQQSCSLKPCALFITCAFLSCWCLRACHCRRLADSASASRASQMPASSGLDHHGCLLDAACMSLQERHGCLLHLQKCAHSCSIRLLAAA